MSDELRVMGDEVRIYSLTSYFAGLKALTMRMARHLSASAGRFMHFDGPTYPYRRAHSSLITQRSALIISLSFLLLSCEEPKQTRKAAGYAGPIEEINDVKLLYSEAAILKVKLTTPKQFRYANDDRKYPKPVSIIFYGPAGEEVTTLRSDSGRYNKAKDLYTVMGNVVVINKQKQEKLLTPELNWNPVTKKVFTEKRVMVLSQMTGEKLYGIGMDANQDFSQYSIRKPTGIFNAEGGPGM